VAPAALPLEVGGRSELLEEREGRGGRGVVLDGSRRSSTDERMDPLLEGTADSGAEKSTLLLIRGSSSSSIFSCFTVLPSRSEP